MNPVEQLLEVMAALRNPERGCPWDLEQTYASLAPHTLEEAYEVAEAAEAGDLGELREELGDLLFQVVFYARIAEEADEFTFADVAAAIVEKLVRRHPHVFGEAVVADAAEQTEAWEAHKAAERQRKAADRGTEHLHSLLDGVSLALPALTRARKLQSRAARAGFDWPDIDGVFRKLDEEIRELREARAGADGPERVEAELGDLLFTCVNLARHAGVDPERALRAANHRFSSRFRYMEARLAAEGTAPEQAGPERLERLWAAAKDRLG
ncbi:nucleoside triphosphate pyrophosphohydrolase [Thioalbus denitrificans]|uniref:ATP diphosphatase n=1 Tax=Thioalbus denitrificans TaxID=547122 RepID=A0A369CD01_9GAMM|nr:nucleoside triphosphate pyrophosphohydrolase [Thioalbus denitrificans]RCX31880.1 ATP diphosphatase [Thioalbus denitrificans]